MELRVLRYFLAAAREHSISRAAEALNVTQPTLSKQIMDLEDELESELFVRNKSSRRLELTADGLQFFQYASEIVELSDKAKKEFTAKRRAVSGDICIGAGETDAMGILARAAKRLSESHPLVRYHLFSGDAEIVSERLDKGLLDFGLFVGDANIEKYNHIELSCTDIWGIVMPEGCPLSQKDCIRARDLDGVPLFLSRQSLAANSLAGWYGEGYDTLHIAGTYTLGYNAAVMAKNGMGCVVGIDRLLDTSAGSGLCFRPLEPRLELRLHLVWRKDWTLSEAARLFLSSFKAENGGERQD